MCAIKIVDTADNTLNESLSTNLNPQRVAFCTQGTPFAPNLGATVSGNSVMAHWNTVSGAEGYYLWASCPTMGWSAMYDWGARNSVSATIPSGQAYYVVVIPYNAEGTGSASNAVTLQAD